MSCRRGERARFIGCHIGSPALSGCGNGCCRSWGPEGIEENERINYLTGWAPETSRWPDSPDSKYAHPCTNPGRPRYVCFTCRRTFKPAVIPGNEYKNASFLREEWLVRPGRESVEIRAVGQARRRLIGRNTEEYRRVLKEESAISGQLSRGERPDEAITEKLKAVNPDLWWKRLGSRCPGCGGDGQPVGSTFRAPKRDDLAAWHIARHRVEAGDEFRFCATKEDDAELRVEAARIRRRNAQSQAWDREKLRRQHDLGLSVQRLVSNESTRSRRV
ncbi:unnamed protein product [Peniophora sp. CBMAI 1063]|nr:unnamed protein product [Peniophora sp. CBMAI 1063]